MQDNEKNRPSFTYQEFPVDENNPVRSIRTEGRITTVTYDFSHWNGSKKPPEVDTNVAAAAAPVEENADSMRKLRLAKITHNQIVTYTYSFDKDKR